MPLNAFYGSKINIMKTLKFNTALLILVLLAATSFARKEEFSKEISKSFDIDKNANLIVKNKFGLVHCANWDKSSISIKVTITVDASDQKKANSYFDKIDISLTGNRAEVKAVTEFGNNAFGNNNNISVDYLIYLPASVNVDIKNKFGEVIVDEVGGTADIYVAYGSLRAKRLLNEDNKLKMSFSEGCFIGYLNSADVELKYSDLEVSEVKNISLETGFSELKIGAAEVITLESGYDDLYVGTVRDIDIDSDFSDLEIRNVKQRLVADYSYGDLNVKQIDKDFLLIDLDNSFGDAKIGIEEGASFKLIANIKMGDFEFPEDNARLSVVDLSFSSNKYEGVIGGNENTKSKVILETSHSDVSLFFR